ncbi:hypothetical protein BTVI_74859 [Pitangus sulphuratus]|nr:hypothetical protein BTVI_74859 [Pitangus sulphuratus]
MLLLLQPEKLWVGGTATGNREGVHREKINLTSTVPLKDMDLELQCLSPKPPRSPFCSQQTAPGVDLSSHLLDYRKSPKLITGGLQDVNFPITALEDGREHENQLPDGFCSVLSHRRGGLLHLALDLELLGKDY